MNARSAILVAAALTATHVARAADFVIDTVHAQIDACVSHLGFSTPCARLKVKSGTFRFDDAHWNEAKLDVVVDTASTDLGDARWNATVRSWQFLDAGKYPQAHFASTSVENTGDHQGIVHGTLDLRGVSHAVDLAVTFHRAGIDPYNFRYTAGFSATATLKRSDFGMTKYLPDIGDAVTIRIEVEGLRGEPGPAHTAPSKPEP
jgi:polyisoprenoid-binding protein YceI